MRKICSEEGMPAQRTVYEWLSQDDEFRSRCARAREAQGDTMFDRVIDTAGKVEDGSLAPDAGRVVISALQWTASKLAPKKYGDATLLKHGDADGNKLVPIVNVTIANA